MVGMVACGYNRCLYCPRTNTPLKVTLIITLRWCCASKNYIATKFSASPCVDFKVSCYVLTVGPCTLLSTGSLHLLRQWSINWLFSWNNGFDWKCNQIFECCSWTQNLCFMNPRNFTGCWPIIKLNHETHVGFWIPQNLPYYIPTSFHVVANWLWSQCWDRYFLKVTYYWLLVTIAKSNMLQLQITSKWK